MAMPALETFFNTIYTGTMHNYFRCTTPKSTYIPLVTMKENFIFIFQDGKVAITRVANLILCLYAQQSVGLGMLKAKVLTLIRF